MGAVSVARPLVDAAEAFRGAPTAENMLKLAAAVADAGTSLDALDLELRANAADKLDPNDIEAQTAPQ